jgi:hypothetical protein
VIGIGSGQRGLKSSIGRFSNGTLAVGSRDIERVKSDGNGRQKKFGKRLGNRASNGKKINHKKGGFKKKRRNH